MLIFRADHLLFNESINHIYSYVCVIYKNIHLHKYNAVQNCTQYLFVERFGIFFYKQD